MPAILEQLLSGRYLATLATWNPDGSIHLSVVWFLHHEGTVLVATSGNDPQGAKCRPPAERFDPDRRTEPADLRGAASPGAIEILRGAGASELNERIWRKYTTAEGLDAPDVGGAIRANDDVTIRFTPDRWRTWGTAADLDGAFETARTSFPLDT